jgi:ketosteroid isomerase-like protein
MSVFLKTLRYAALVYAVLLLAACAGTMRPDAEPDSNAIRSLLISQQTAWNRGDIDGFMQGYRQSEELRFASGDTVTYGWKATRERYLQRYPDRAAMGKLTFSELQVEVLAPDAAVIFGRFSLQREKDRPHGIFTLVARKFGEGWRIVADHTSAAP